MWDSVRGLGKFNVFVHNDMDVSWVGMESVSHM